MDGLIELVFDNVPDSAIAFVVGALTQNASIIEVTHSEFGNLDLKKTLTEIQDLLLSESMPTSVFLRTVSVVIGDVTILNALIRVVRANGANEVLVAFRGGDIEAPGRSSAIELLASAADSLATSAGVPSYYCGFEPATDQSTRLFSNQRMGPLTAI